MAGFFKGMLRANAANYGDLEGPMTKLKSGKLTLTIEKGAVIAWIVGQDDIELNKTNVKAVDLISSNIMVRDLGSGGGKPWTVNVYRITMADDSVGTLRLVANTEYKVLQLIK